MELMIWLQYNKEQQHRRHILLGMVYILRAITETLTNEPKYNIFFPLSQ